MNEKTKISRRISRHNRIKLGMFYTLRLERTSLDIKPFLIAMPFLIHEMHGKMLCLIFIKSKSKQISLHTKQSRLQLYIASLFCETF